MTYSHLPVSQSYGINRLQIDVKSQGECEQRRRVKGSLILEFFRNLKLDVNCNEIKKTVPDLVSGLIHSCGRRPSLYEDWDGRINLKQITQKGLHTHFVG